VATILPGEGWHAAAGNGMVVPNCGMVIVATLACLEPTEKLKHLMAKCAEASHTQGIPPSMKYHGGWKKWILAIGGQNHQFLTKEQALDVHRWLVDVNHSLTQKSVAAMKEQLDSKIGSGKRRAEVVEALVRQLYRATEFSCVCCKAHRVPGMDGCLCNGSFRFSDLILYRLGLPSQVYTNQIEEFLNISSI